MLNFIFLLSAFFVLDAKALTKDEIKAEIYSQMNERHPKPVGDFWTHLGPEALPVIKEMFQASTSPVEKSWLIDGLAHFSDESVGDLLKNEIKSSDNAVFKKKMVGALIESQGDASYDFIEPYLNDKDPHVRLAVAQGMKRYMSSGRAQARLEKFKGDETQAWVKSDFEKSNANGPMLMKRAGSVYEPKDEVVSVKPLPEKEWAGEWSGVYITQLKPKTAVATLTQVEKNWKVDLKLPKQSKYELKREGLEILYYQSARMHWIEIRNKKEDAVFIGSRKQ